MTFLDYLQLMRRHLNVVIFMAVIVAVTTSFFVHFKNSKSYESTIFITIGAAEQTTGTFGIYQNVQAADNFSETIQGWFKNPEFINRINTKSYSKSDLSARKQEKQNVVISYTTPTLAEAENLGNIIKSELSSEIENYNQKTTNKFQIAIFGINTDQKPLSLTIFLLIAIIGGGVLTAFGLYGYEYFLRKISSPEQASHILQKQPIEELPSLETKSSKLHFLSAYLQKIEEKNIQLIGTDINIKNLEQALSHSIKNKPFSSIKFPAESQKITTYDYHIIVCTLGKTSQEDLQKLQTLLPQNFDLVIVKR